MIIWRIHPLNEIIAPLKIAYRNQAYLAWLRKQKCYSCPARNDITASHILRGYHGLKNHDWASVPMCGPCHWLYEYHKEEFEDKWKLPTIGNAEKYFQEFLKATGREDNRTEIQMKTI